MIDAIRITVTPSATTPGNRWETCTFHVEGKLWPADRPPLHIDYRECYPRDMLKSELRSIFERLAWRIEQIACDAQKDTPVVPLKADELP